MARLIDADKLLTKVVAVSNSMGQVTWSAVSTIDILTAPTVDAVEVVRCRECKHYEIHKPKVLENCERNGYIIPMKPNDFCSYGERKDDDGNG